METKTRKLKITTEFDGDSVTKTITHVNTESSDSDLATYAAMINGFSKRTLTNISRVDTQNITYAEEEARQPAQVKGVIKFNFTGAEDFKSAINEEVTGYSVVKSIEFDPDDNSKVKMVVNSGMMDETKTVAATQSRFSFIAEGGSKAITVPISAFAGKYDSTTGITLAQLFAAANDNSDEVTITYADNTLTFSAAADSGITKITTGTTNYILAEAISEYADGGFEEVSDGDPFMATEHTFFSVTLS